MPATLDALLIGLLAFLPGGVHTWAFERVTGKSEHLVGDRLPRLLAASALYLVLAIPAFPILETVARSASSGTTTDGWRYTVAVTVLVVVPFVIGSGAGALTNRRHQSGVVGWLGRRVGGVGHASRAWDHLFATKGLTGTIRVVLNDGTQVIGTWAQRTGAGAPGNPPALSYASGYPSQQRDLYISQLIRIDYPDSTQNHTDAAAWIPVEAVRYLEFYPHQENGDNDARPVEQT